MWKESYLLGVDSIDKQHMELFDMTESLLKAIEDSDTNKHKKECEKTILFLKQYALEHFADEEKYMSSIQYCGFTEHQRLHQGFVSDVLKYEEKMISSDFSMVSIIDFTGMLTAWLAYHVAGADQKILNNEQPSKIIIDSFFSAFCTSLNRMAHINKSDIKKINNRDNFKGDVAVSVDLLGDVPCTVEYVFTEEFIFKLLKSFLFITTKSMDSIARSILLEISNIISRDALLELNKRGVCCNINTIVMQLKPSISTAKDFLVLDTNIGKLEIGICTYK